MKRKLLLIFLVPLAAVAVFVLLLLARYYWAASQVASQSLPPPEAKITDLGSTRSLTVLPLYENESASGDLFAGHGVSYWIKTDSATILFDVGFNPDNTDPSPLEANLKALGVSIEDADTVFISHNHPDHTGGTGWWMKKTFSPYASSQPPFGDRPVYVPAAMTYPGSAPLVAAPAGKIAKGVATTGAIPFTTPLPLGVLAPSDVEEVLAVNVEGRGIVLISGCGHPGLERMVGRAQALFEQPVAGVIGGLHYMGQSVEALRPHIQFLQELDPQIAALSPHDSDPSAIQAFRQAFGERYRTIRVGEAIAFPHSP